MNFELFLEWREGKRVFSQTFGTEYVGHSQGIKIDWREKVLPNNSRQILIKLDPGKKISLLRCELHSRVIGGIPESMFCNGYQSWTTSKERTGNEKSCNQVFWPVSVFGEQNGDYTFAPASGGRGVHHSWTYTYFRWTGSNEVTHLGSISESFAYTSFRYNFKNHELIVAKDVEDIELGNEETIFNLFYGHGEEKVVWDTYSSLWGKPKQLPRCSGWVSWYNYYTKITESIILENLENYSKYQIPIEFFEIDDGYQQAVGDWLTVNKKFPRGMKYLSDEIKKTGAGSGIWLAPLVCEKKSMIFKQHPDWIVKDAKGNPVKASYNPVWKSWIYPLDIYHPGVRDYLAKVFDTVLNEWGYDMVKLDFLFAACYQPRKDRSRGRIMSDALTMLREMVGDKIMLGCGVPLGPGFNLFDYCRIGSDVAELWDIKPLKYFGVQERLSTSNSLTSTLGRWQLNHRMFVNDGDVFMIREKGIYLKKEERDTLFLVNNIFSGTIFTSDNIADYSQEIMDQYLSMFPVPANVEILSLKNDDEFYLAKFRVGGGVYEAYINLRNEKVNIDVDCGYSSGLGYVHHRTVPLKKHESICILIDYVGPCQEIILRGSTDHLFPGSTLMISGQDGNYQVFTTSKRKSVELLLEYQGIKREISINNKTYQITAENTPLRLQLIPMANLPLG